MVIVPTVTLVDEIITTVNTPTQALVIDGEQLDAQVFVVGVGVSAPLFGTTVVTLQTKPLDWPDNQYIDFATVISGATPPEQSKILGFRAPCSVQAVVKSGSLDQNVRVRLTV